jgi:hypothetical protein
VINILRVKVIVGPEHAILAGISTAQEFIVRLDHLVITQPSTQGLITKCA